MYDIFKCVRAEVYYNTRKLNPAQIKAETGCTHIIGGFYFNNDSKSKDYFKPLCWLRVDGKTLFSDQWQDWGFACDKTGAPEMSTDRTKPYFMGFRPLLKDGKETVRTDTPDVARYSEKQAVGWTKDGYVILWCDKKKFYMPGLIEHMQSLGAVDAGACDGGGSVQGIFPKGKVTSSRKLPMFLLFWATNEEYEPKGEKPAMTDDIRAYSLKKDGGNNLTEHFKVKEFACKDGTDTIFISQKLVLLCECLRVRINKPLVVNSAYRTEAYNKKVGGAEFSQHLYGAAVDLKTPAGWTPEKMAAIARKNMTDWGGVGIYDWGIHVDVRKEKADWHG